MKVITTIILEYFRGLSKTLSPLLIYSIIIFLFKHNENELLTQMNPNTRTNQIINALREIPVQDNADNIKFRKLFCHVIAYSRDKLLFIVGNDNLKNIPKYHHFFSKVSILIK